MKGEKYSAGYAFCRGVQSASIIIGWSATMEVIELSASPVVSVMTLPHSPVYELCVMAFSGSAI
jgi:hypothetical protein